MALTKRLTVDLPTELIDDMQRRVEAGDFASQGELVRVALQDWLEPEDWTEGELAEVRAAVSEGVTEAEAGDLIEAEKVHAYLRARIKDLSDQRK
jgi:Arc/MetJ-type ribon-helix-helix transcriptional regulator